mmetsp:Transcript_36006/g.66180  ORF Transcript_36006/g.66180 Transcript_36006/m.66180 type:complete len:214 (-) Transcript_36006:382-1023(-)
MSSMASYIALRILCRASSKFWKLIASIWKVRCPSSASADLELSVFLIPVMRRKRLAAPNPADLFIPESVDVHWLVCKCRRLRSPLVMPKPVLAVKPAMLWDRPPRTPPAKPFWFSLRSYAYPMLDICGITGGPSLYLSTSASSLAICLMSSLFLCRCHSASPSKPSAFASSMAPKAVLNNPPTPSPSASSGLRSGFAMRCIGISRVQRNVPSM